MPRATLVLVFVLSIGATRTGTGQVVVLSPLAGLYAPTGNFLVNSSNYRARFGAAPSYGGVLMIRPVRQIGLSVRAFGARPNFNYAVPNFSGGTLFTGHTIGRVSGVAVQVAGFVPLGPRTLLALAVGPAWIANKSRTLPSETDWFSYNSRGWAGTLQLQQRLGHVVYGTVSASDFTYRSDVALLPGDPVDPSRRQHDLLLSVGLGLGYSQ